MSSLEILRQIYSSDSLIGIGSVLVAMAGSYDEDGFRPLMKLIVRGGIQFYDMSKELVTRMGDQLGELIAEVRSQKNIHTGSKDSSSVGGAGRSKSQRRTNAKEVSKKKKNATE